MAKELQCAQVSKLHWEAIFHLMICRYIRQAGTIFERRKESEKNKHTQDRSGFLILKRPPFAIPSVGE